MARTDKSLVANRSMSASFFYREIAAPPNVVRVWQISVGINCVCLLLSLYICREAFIARQRKRNQKAFTQHILRFFVGQAGGVLRRVCSSKDADLPLCSEVPQNIVNVILFSK